MKLALVALLAACGGNPVTPETPPASAAPSDTAAYEAVLLHEIGAGAVRSDEVICIRVRGVDAAGPIVEAVMKTHPAAHDGAGCTGGGFDPVVGPNGEPAVMFDVGPLERSGGVATMKGGGAHRGGGSAREILYTLEPNGAGFRVASEKVLLEN